MPKPSNPSVDRVKNTEKDQGKTYVVRNPPTIKKPYTASSRAGNHQEIKKK